MSNEYQGGYTRRQELTCTEAQIATYADIVLHENEKIYVRMNSGVIRMKLGDGVTCLRDLPYTKVYDGTLEEVEAMLNTRLMDISGVLVSPEEPTNPDVSVWIDPDEEDGENFLTEADIAQGLGDRPDMVVSQKAATDEAYAKAELNAGTNLFDKNSRYNTQGKYLQGNGVEKENESYSISGYISIKPNTNYAISYEHFGYGAALCWYDENFVFISGRSYSDLSTIAGILTSPENAAYVRLSIRFADQLQFEEGNKHTPYKPFVPFKQIEENTDRLDNHDKELAKTGLTNKGYFSAKGNLSTGGELQAPLMNIKKNNVYSFMAKITSFGSLKIGQGANNYGASYLTIDNTNVVLTNMGWEAVSETHAHGLTISGYICITIKVGVEKADVSITSGGRTFTLAELPWQGCSWGKAMVVCNEGTLTDCTFTWACDDFNKKLYAFGDSYFSFENPERWTYYLNQDGFLGNVLMNGYPGESSGSAVTALTNILSLGTPQKILWCVGMNDGSDNTDGTPPDAWMNSITTMLNMCKERNIEPILATIPSVPTRFHEHKNTWVRNSGYRYVDFAKAVGATAEGAWFDGMLSSDGVHPYALGAKALYTQALCDCPELTFE